MCIYQGKFKYPSNSYLCCTLYTYRHVLHINNHKYHLSDLSSILILTSLYTIQMQTKKTTHPPLGNRTTTAGSCVRSNLGSPSRKSSSWGGCLFCDISILVPMMWLICWKISGIVYLAWKFLTLLLQWWGKKRFLVSTEFSRLTHPAGNRQVLSFTAGPCFFSLCFLRDSLCYVH